VCVNDMHTGAVHSTLSAHTEGVWALAEVCHCRPPARPLAERDRDRACGFPQSVAYRIGACIRSVCVQIGATLQN
jgi:hypothetical protein